MSMQSITTWIFSLTEPLKWASCFADEEGTALLFSGGNLDSAQSSYLCLFPEKKITLSASESCWQSLQRELNDFAPDAHSLPYYVGYLGYEMGCFADPDKYLPYFKPNVPDCCFYKPSVIIHFDHLTHKATLYAKNPNFSLKESSLNIKTETNTLSIGSCSDTLESYLEKIKLAKEWILEGEIYQVNLSQEILLKGSERPFSLFEKINALNPAPFSAFINCKDFSIVSSSPERFLRKKKHVIETRPIKGTAPRGKNESEDLESRKALLSSEKERAELLMITDLMRSDLSRIAHFGSVKTKAIWHCEEYANVFHLLSIIEGEVNTHANPVEMIRKLFPGGSITGCPKLRAMQAIAALEKRARGIYTGSIGYFAENGDFDFNIAIRTLIVHPESIQMQLGGAIVFDSDPKLEFEETLHKGRSLFSALGLGELFLCK